MTEREAAQRAWERIRPSFNRRLPRILVDAEAFRESVLEKRGRVGDLDRVDNRVEGAAARESDYADWMARRFFHDCLNIWTEVLLRQVSKAFYQGVFIYCLSPFFADRERWFQNQLHRQKKIREVPDELIGDEIRNFGDRMFALQSLWRSQLDSHDLDAQRKARIRRLKADAEKPAERAVTRSSTAAAARRSGAVAESSAAGAAKRPGPKSKRNPEFVKAAGRLWNVELKSSPNRRIDQSGLERIAQQLDELGFSEPADWLEGAAGKALKAFNSKNSTSTPGPIRT